MAKSKLCPDYIFEASWEVCNKVGGIYTVLSTRAKTLQEILKDKIIFIGPDLSKKTDKQDFIENANLLKSWKKYALETDNLKIRVGRWDIPGKPIAILIDFEPFYSSKNDLYFRMWDKFGVKSLQAYGDYDDSSIFAYATGVVIESFYKFHQLEKNQVVAHFNEWMLGMGALYIKDKLPSVATIFTTHATSIGRSIAGNNKPLYSYFRRYNGDQMAEELNMEAKHSIEKQTAYHVDCFTTVSDITACECSQLLEKNPDIVTPNGFEDNFVPKEKNYIQKRKKARQVLLKVAEQLTGKQFAEDSLILGTSGRYEYKNKGIDVFVEAMSKIRFANMKDKTILAFIFVPGWTKGPRLDLQCRMQNNTKSNTPLSLPYVTHELYEPENDNVCRYLQYLDFKNRASDRIKIIFVPSYLTGEDGIFNLSYYDILIGLDLTVFPSYYEPWGYTPLESIAFGIPTITTNLAGFGLWAMKEKTDNSLMSGVEVLERTDENYFVVADSIKDSILSYMNSSQEAVDSSRKTAMELSEKASWSHFIKYYLDAYDIALKNAMKRNKNKH